MAEWAASALVMNRVRSIFSDAAWPVSGGTSTGGIEEWLFDVPGFGSWAFGVLIDDYRGGIRSAF